MMSNRFFPYFHVVQLGRMDMSKELLLGSILCAIFVLCLAVQQRRPRVLSLMHQSRFFPLFFKKSFPRRRSGPRSQPLPGQWRMKIVVLAVFS
jgi:hypothetical protein